MLPEWQLPAGVDRGLWDYLHAADMVAGYDGMMAASPLAKADVVYCEAAFPTPGKLVDLGCGTGRLCRHFTAKGFECVGVDLSEEMLRAAQSPGIAIPGLSFLRANLVDLALPDAEFDYAACLFSTLGMVRGAGNRAKVVANAFRLLKPGGRFVLHAHNRFFRGLGWGRVIGEIGRSAFGVGGDITMSQAYGGAPLTLHHFTRRGVLRLLEAAGFTVTDVRAIGLNGEPAWLAWHVYGWLIRAEKPR